jgi:hypothetical protein
MTKKTAKYLKHIENNTKRADISYRGGGIEIDVTSLLPRTSEENGGDSVLMTAYANYLGGGLMGSVQSDMNVEPTTAKEQKIADEMAEVLKRYFLNVSNEGNMKDEWNTMIYEKNQVMPNSGY